MLSQVADQLVKLTDREGTGVVCNFWLKFTNNYFSMACYCCTNFHGNQIWTGMFFKIWNFLFLITKFRQFFYIASTFTNVIALGVSGSSKNLTNLRWKIQNGGYLDNATQLPNDKGW